jgi:hypothetical protein
MAYDETKPKPPINPPPIPTNNWAAEHVLGWESMPRDARATACYLAIRGRIPMEPAFARWDPQAGLVYMVQPVKFQSPRVATERLMAEAEALSKIRAGWGTRADDAARLIRRR